MLLMSFVYGMEYDDRSIHSLRTERVNYLAHMSWGLHGQNPYLDPTSWELTVAKSTDSQS